MAASGALLSDIEATSVNALRQESELLYMRDSSQGKKFTSMRSLHVPRDPLTDWEESRESRELASKLPSPEEKSRNARPKSAKVTVRKMTFSGFSFRTAKSSPKNTPGSPPPVHNFLTKGASLSRCTSTRPQTAKHTTLHNAQATDWFIPKEAFSYLVRLRSALKPTGASMERKKSPTNLVSFSKLDFKPLQTGFSRPRGNDVRSPYRTSDPAPKTRKAKCAFLHIAEIL